MIFALVVLVLLIFSALFNLTQFVHGLIPMKLHGYSSSAGPRLDEVVLQDNDAHNKIAVIPVEGIITSASIDGDYNLVELIRAQLKEAANDAKVKAVILKVNSPGGEVLPSDEISKLLADFQLDEPAEGGMPAHKGKPIIVSMGSLAASGGYYVSAPCKWIVANEMTITGSIGVIMESYNYRGLMDKVGLQPVVFKSGKFKDMLSGSREPTEITQEERDMVQNLINEVYGKFKSVVAAGRKGHSLSPNWQDYADGRVLSGKQALDLGFVDELGDFDDAVERAKTIAGIAEANVVEYRARRDLSDMLGLFGKTQVPSIKLDLGMEGPKLEAGQLYFLSSTVVH